MVLSLADTSCCCPLSGRNRDCSLATEGKSSFLNSLTNSTRESYTSIMKSCASKIKVGTHPTVTLMSPAFREFFKAAACRLLVWCLKNRGWQKGGFLCVFVGAFPVYPRFTHVTPHTWHPNTGAPSCSVCNRSVSACKSWRVVRLGAVFVDPWDFDVNFLMFFLLWFSS